MKTIKINTESWHYRCMRGLDFQPSTLDMCAYIRAMIKSIGLLFIFSVFAAITAASFGDFFAWIAAMIITWNIFVYHDIAILAVIIVSLIMFVLLSHLINSFNKSKSTLIGSHVSEDVKVMWDSFRNKMCAKIEFVEPKH